MLMMPDNSQTENVPAMQLPSADNPNDMSRSLLSVPRGYVPLVAYVYQLSRDELPVRSAYFDLILRHTVHSLTKKVKNGGDD